MFDGVLDSEVGRLSAAAPERPTLDEVFDRYPPTGPGPDEGGDDLGAGPDEGGPRLGVVADIAPSGWTALDLDIITDDPVGLADDELIDAMAGFGRIEAWAQARQTRLIAEFDRRRTGSAGRWAPDEVGLAMAVSRVVAVGRISRARRLVDTLTDTLALFEAGRIGDHKARLICEAVERLDDTQACWVQDRVLPRAPEQSPAQLRAVLARAVIAVDPEGANDRHRKARTDRRVVLGAEDDGMAPLWALLSAPDAQSVHHTLTGLARGLGADDPRGMDARRADLLVALLRGELSIAHADTPRTADTAGSGADAGDAAEPDTAEPAGDAPATADSASTEPPTTEPPTTEPVVDEPVGDEPVGDEPTSVSGSVATTAGASPAGGNHSGDTRGRCAVCVARAWQASRPRVRPVNPTKPLVHVVMGHATLRGADHDPAELVGYGPICADAAREIAADAVWKRLVYDELSGALLDHGRRTYRPPTALADHVRARDVYCRSPLCRRRALDCELDHTIAYPEGPTAEHNLTDACVLHHHEKHAPGWTVVQHPDGRLDWVTPTGHVHTSEVHDYRPLPPPPVPHLPGPIADRSHKQPPPTAAPPRPPRVRYDWTGVDSPTGGPAPF